MKSIFPNTEACVFSMNVPHKKEITKEILLSILNGKQDVMDWVNHFEILFSDIPFTEIEALLKENSLPFELIANTYNKMPKVYQYGKFKEYIHGKMATTA